MDYVGLACLLALVGIGAFAIFKPVEFHKIFSDLVASPSAKETKKPKKQKKGNKKKLALSKAETTAEAAGTPAPAANDEATPQPDEGSAPANDDDDGHKASAEDEDQDSGVNFLGVDDVLPNSWGVYAVQGTADDAALLDGWEMVDTVKYNIPRADTHGNRGKKATTTAQTAGKAAAAQSSGGGASKSRNDRRREKQQMVRQGIQQKKAGGASVAERMGTSFKRVQKEPHNRNTVPGM